MYHDEIFKSALTEAKAESIVEYKREIVSMEKAIQKFLSNILEYSDNISESDFQLQ